MSAPPSPPSLGKVTTGPKTVSFSLTRDEGGDEAKSSGAPDVHRKRLLTPLVPTPGDVSSDASPSFQDRTLESIGEEAPLNNAHELSSPDEPASDVETKQHTTPRSDAAPTPAAGISGVDVTTRNHRSDDEPSQGQSSHKLPPPPPPLKSALRGSSNMTLSKGATVKPQTLYCDDCKKEIPLEEWLNHRDRLRTVEIKRRLSGLQRYLTTLFVDFFMWILVNVYFREVAVVGLERIPKDGPVVFYGNHQNQFIDAMMIRALCGRSVRFIIAEKSMHRPIIGHFARMMEAVPVVRPQDVPSIFGQGRMVRMEKNVVFGEGTNFLSTLTQGDVISWAVPGKKDRCSGQVHNILSDSQLSLTMPVKAEDMIAEPTPFKFSRRIDHSEMYAEVYSTLAQGNSIGIFPEGGSHDRTSLLPLKAGVALFTLGAYERNIRPYVIPCGLTYFYGHKFRSRAHIEFGEPIVPSEDVVEIFATDKRKATGIFLEELALAIRGVTINVPDWGALKFLHAFRRLYQPADCMLTTGDYLKLTRRLAMIMEEHESDARFADFRAKVENYSDYCSALLVRDSQAATLERLDEAQGATIVGLLFRRVAMLMVMWIVLIPFFIVAAPIGLISHVASEHHAKTALSTSSVKVVAADVKGSFKIVMGFALVPLETLVVSILVYWSTGDLRTAITVLFSLPMAMYVSLLILQESILELRAALPLVMSLFSKHKQFKKLYDRRQKLVGLAKDLVKMFDSALDEELAAYRSATSVREPSLFSLRHSGRRLADKMK